MIKLVGEEFNCNHQADIDSKEQVKIYNREEEHDKIEKFLAKNIS